LAVQSAVAQTEGAPPASQPQAPPPSSLDDPTQPHQDAAAQQSERELQKQLSEAEVADAFEQAMEKMGIAAELLDVRFDAGLDTQRVQEDILAKLNQLLDQAKKSKSSSSSSSSSRQQQNQQKQDPGKRQQQKPQNASNEQRNRDPADNRSEVEPPGQEAANANAMIEETRTEWGNLPQRIRDQLIQGRKEKFSTLYERLTHDYYKRLAEEGSP
jgi:hypothetical protein